MSLVPCVECGGLLFRTLSWTDEELARQAGNRCTCKPMRPCVCPDSVAGWKSLEAQISSAVVHGVGYDGPRMKFCPWCGTKRERES